MKYYDKNKELHDSYYKMLFSNIKILFKKIFKKK